MALSVTGVMASQKPLTDDLGHTDWEEIEPGYFIAAELVQQDDSIVVFDILAEFDLQYVRFEGDCEEMTVQELRLGGFVGMSGSEVSFGDMSEDLWRFHDASEGTPHHRFLSPACEKREV